MTDVNDVLRREFIQESAQTLVEADATLRRMAEDDEDTAPLIQELFRLIHSLKGNAALFDCQALKRLAHAAEDVLAWLRDIRLPPLATVELLQQAIDDMIEMVDDLTRGQLWADDDPRVQERCAALMALVTDQEAQVTREVAAALRALGAEHPDVRDEVDALAERLQPQSPRPGSNGETPLEQLLAFLSEPLPEDGHGEEAQDWLGQCLHDLGQAAADEATTQAVEEIIAGYQTFVESIGFDGLLQEYLQEHLGQLLTSGQWSWSQAFDIGSDSAVSGSGAEVETHEKTMRVAERHIETFLAYVGDLLVIGDRYHHLQRAVQPGADMLSLARDLRHANAAFQQLSEALQRSIMAVRQVAAEGLLSKAARLVRSVAAQGDKQVAVTCHGHQVQLDKSLVELLDAPMTHLVRNAVDHGVENDQQRRQADKPIPAQITISVREREQHIEVAVSDDGRGLDLAAIAQAARARGLLAIGQDLDERALVDCIFAPGLSTSRTVSDISGRGVGLDVVRQKITEAGGDIQVYTSAQGSCFRITLPRTVSTQIISGFMVRSGGDVVIFPMEQVERSYPFNAEQVHVLPDGRPCLQLSGSTLPLICLQRILQHDSAAATSSPPVVVHCRSGSQSVAVLVDSLLGVQKVVLRPMTAIPQREGLVRGGALLGDGHVALVINTDILHQLWSNNDGVAPRLRDTQPIGNPPA